MLAAPSWRGCWRSATRCTAPVGMCGGRRSCRCARPYGGHFVGHAGMRARACAAWLQRMHSGTIDALTPTARHAHAALPACACHMIITQGGSSVHSLIVAAPVRLLRATDRQSELPRAARLVCGGGGGGQFAPLCCPPPHSSGELGGPYPKHRDMSVYLVHSGALRALTY